MRRVLGTGAAWPRWTVAALSVAVTILDIVVSVPQVGLLRTVAWCLPALGLTVAGTIAWRERPALRTGPIMSLCGLLAALGVMQSTQTRIPLFFTLAFVVYGGYQSVLVHLTVAFPTSRLTTRAQRLIVGIAYAMFPLNALSVVFEPDLPRCADCSSHADLLVVGALRPYGDVAIGFFLVLNVVVPLWAIWILAQRWRAATRPARRVLGPVLWGTVATAVGLAGTQVAYLIHPTDLAQPHIPLGVALVQGLPTLLFGLLPFAFIVGLLRTRVTRSTIGRLVVELSPPPPAPRLQELLADALGDRSVALGFWLPEERRLVGVDGAALERPADPQASTEVNDEAGLLAVIVHDPALVHEEGLLETVAGVARLAIGNARLTAELQAQLAQARASRQRLLAAADAERRRIERDLHDGAQQQLVGLLLLLSMAQPEPPDGALAAAEGATRAALTQLRALAAGLQPLVLVDEGLRGGLDALAQLCPLPVALESVPRERLSEPLEVCVYLVCAEALANAVRHAAASAVSIGCARTPAALTVTIADDGVGAADPDGGTGLDGLRERVELLDGNFELDSPRGAGTTIRITLPLSPAADAPAPSATAVDARPRTRRLRTRVTRQTLGALVAALAADGSGAGLRTALASALGDRELELGLWLIDRDGYVDVHGQPLRVDPGRATTAISGTAGPLALLVHDPALARDPGLIEAVAATARLTLENARLQAAIRAQLRSVQASRARLAGTADRERRRIDGDLRHSVLARLADVEATLNDARRRLAGDARATELIELAVDAVATTAAELAELARGLHPQLLADTGLSGALAALAERAPVPVRIAGVPARRLPEPIEACVYFTCSEALQNVAKYARASSALIECEDHAGELRFAISDDGIGGAQIGTGSGLIGLRDRIEALSGSFRVHSPPGAGTQLTGLVPVPDPS